VNALIFSGYDDLDIRRIFYTAFILSAAMDEIKNLKNNRSHPVHFFVGIQ